ncbi:MAG: heparan-alpha-glucosaminide N-acetyltransferase domain-containing protein [Chitinophagales bacterium]
MTAGSGRIVFLDVVRAFAILMMLQGHFVDTMLDPAYRDHSNWIYYSWSFMRGITAPVFFFSSGLVFTYLLTRKAKPWRENERLYKGIGRGLQLIAIGYLLRINFLALLFKFDIYRWVAGVDVLHVIGIALLSLIGLYILHQEFRISLPWLLGITGLLVFYLDPMVERGNYSLVPDFLSNYFVNQGYSTFTIFPWIGYTLLGGVVGNLLARYPKVAHTWWLPVLLLGTGLLFHYQSIEALVFLYRNTGVSGFIEWRINNSHLLIRLGDVWVVMALIIWITRIWKNMPALIPKIGSETLTIYSVHYIVLWGTWFGLGINRLGSKTWNPWMSAIGALLFVISFIILIRYIDVIRNRWAAWVREPVSLYYRFVRKKVRILFLYGRSV